MSFGKLNTTLISIAQVKPIKDSEGFTTEKNRTLATVRAYREGRHGTEKWANRAAFSDATDLFRFRVIPGVTVTTDMTIVCDGSRFDITSIEDVKGKNMYIELLGREVKPSG